MAPKKIQTIAKISMKLIVFLIIFKTAALFLSDSISPQEKINIRGLWLAGFILCFATTVYVISRAKRLGEHAFMLGLFLVTFGENIQFIATYRSNGQITNEYLAWTALCFVVSLVCFYYYFPIMSWLKLKPKRNTNEQFA